MSSLEAPKMELLSLKPSPYSQRVVWALKLLDYEYESLQYTSIVGELGLRWRLGRWNPWVPATVPVAFITFKDGKKMILENGVEIVEWANEQATSSTDSKSKSISSLVPSNLRSEVMQYCSLADEFQNFDRSMFLKALAHDPPSVLRAVVGNEPPDVMLRIISKIIGGFMRTKYRSTLTASVSEIQNKAKSLENEIIEKQKKQTSAGSLVYLVGDSITMADIFLSVAVCGGVKDRSKPLTENEVKQADAIAKQGFSIQKEYPTLYQWAVDVSEKHVVDYSLFVDE